ncbi:UNVERIFIED_CONTAM: hypothetical protein Slati_3519100 [Sesamum latifolium]|uniref:Reverse transcriptase n=1 Tax=Sesamum latifolium TaxID=2727402 RepID=A0AAW2UJM0_9LAMI
MEELNLELLRPFTPEDVKNPLDAMHPLKLSGLDEVLNGLVRRAEADGAIRGVWVSRNGPRVSHLLFADGTLIFCDANREAIQVVRDLLATFEDGSGLQINYQKSAIVFSRNVPVHIQEELLVL